MNRDRYWAAMRDLVRVIGDLESLEASEEMTPEESDRLREARRIVERVEARMSAGRRVA